MGFLKKLKPAIKTIDLSELRPDQIEYFCKTKEIDRIRCRRKKIEFNEALADGLETKVRFYFVVKKNMQYDIVSGVLFEPFMQTHRLTELPKTQKAKDCMMNYIDALS